ncbi:MipA/OmpV family protein [Rahnella sp. C60]|uniref:MipA/OmpV family protein n=1 Tax=Rahnella perminowiae TaxID=2816244 RepID=UPI001C27EEEF|nr:MipA/OmpV family protein [Rahnella perminowiae]MBU9809678.1 MipA/OmpV family protein [Rahnella perminowiae]MBU9813457.1 MipA/OmpV family protein [Rahnella perminowiae]
MSNFELRHKFPYLLSERTLKKMLPGALLALLTNPTLAAEPQQGNALTLGGGVDVTPLYSGSDENRVTTALVLDYSMHNGFFVSTMRGIGYGNSSGKLDYSTALSYRAGRKDHDVDSDAMSDGSDDLRGMGDVKGSAIGALGLGYKVTDWLHLQLQAEVPFSQRDNGAALHFGIISPLYSSSENTVTMALTSSWGTDNYMQTYYGVSSSQSAASGFTQYDAGSGIYAYSMNMDWTHKFNQNWSVVAATGFTQLAGDARNSPIVQRKASPNGSLKVTYSF